jgi:LysR family transcriptional regulator, cyn operon transcriptional activator
MNLRHLRTFVTVADAGSFGRATARLNLSQSAASRQIIALEAELGIPLFDRIGRRLRLNSEGEDLLWRSRRLLTDAETLGERAQALKGGQIGTLRVSAPPQVIENILAPFLNKYLRHHSGVEVQLVEGGGSKAHDQLDHGDVNLAHIASDIARFGSRLLYPIYVMAVLPRTHQVSRRPVLDIASLADEPLLLLRQDFGARSWFDAACNVAGVNPRVLLESGAPHTLIALAGVGYGIAVLPSNVQILRGAVRAVPIVHRDAAIGKWAVIAWNPHRFLPPYAEQFANELVAHVQRAYPGRDLIGRAPHLARPKEPASKP